MMRLFVFSFFLITGGSVIAQAPVDSRIATFLAAKKGMNYKAAQAYLEKLFPEWDLKKMQDICMLIGDRTEDVEPGSRFKYTYQQSFYEAARVDTAVDNNTVAASKIASMWKLYQAINMSVCNSLQFDVINGNLIKFAVAQGFDAFINDVIKWKLDLNKIDEYDQRTILDYIEYHINRAKGTAMERTYQTYYERFRKAGAKHKREL